MYGGDEPPVLYISQTARPRTGAMPTSEDLLDAKFEEHPFHILLGIVLYIVLYARYSAVCAAHPQGNELPRIL